jgi:hypothetical protein
VDAVHGIAHQHRELMRPLGPDERRAAFARALMQVERFERRSGVPVSRGLCAPHGEASEPFLRTMLELGLEAAFADLPFPWRAGEPPSGPSLTYWAPANFVAGGLPVIPRYPLTYDRDEVVLRAYLDHPLILYGHHEDVASGLDLLADAAALVNGLGDTVWGAADGIARTNFLARRRGETLEVFMLARRVQVDVPAGVGALEVVAPAVHGDAATQELLCGDHATRIALSNADPSRTQVPASGGERVEIEMRPPAGPLRNDLQPAPLRLWPVVRRVLTEGRDRLRPVIR